MTGHAVVIAGGGPTGMMLAGELTLAGVDVLIVERRASQDLESSRAGASILAPSRCSISAAKDARQAEGITILSCPVEEALRIALEAAGGKNVEVFSPTIGRQLLERGLIDEIDLHIAPILLGEGIRLYDNPGGASVRLELLQGARITRASGRVRRTAPRRDTTGGYRLPAGTQRAHNYADPCPFDLLGGSLRLPIDDPVPPPHPEPVAWGIGERAP